MTTEALAPAGQERWQDTVADVASRVLRRARAVARVARPAAWVLLVAAVVLWIAGQGLGWWELTVAAVVLTVTLVICAIFLFGRTAYEVGLDLTRTHVVVGERAVGALSLANTGRRAILPSRVILPVGSGRGVFAVPRLPAGTEHEELFAIPTQKRGILPVGPVSVVRGDPLGLFERVHSRNDPVDLYVHPQDRAVRGPVARASSATSRGCPRPICPATTCRSTPCAPTSRAMTCATCTGSRPPARAMSWCASTRRRAARTS